MDNYIELKIRHREKLNPEFKRVVKEMRQDLFVLKQELNEEDHIGTPLEDLIKKYYLKTKTIIMALLFEPDQIAKTFSEEEHLAHKDYYRDQLGALLWPAPLHHRALLKPLGYAGDYQIMNMLYDEFPFHGATSYDKLVNAASCRSIAGKAVAARVPFFLNRITNIVSTSAQQNKKCRILNLGSGPAKEVQEFIKIHPLTPDIEFHFVDQDQEALDYSKSVIKSPSVFFHHLSVKDFFNEETIGGLGSFNLIYSSGLFDYLNDNMFQAIIFLLYGLLNNGGTLLIGNFSPENYAKTGLWYLDDWPLIYRTKEELMNLTFCLPNPKSMEIESEETGINLFLKIINV